jgi:SAM-dependent methyltransferase
VQSTGERVLDVGCGSGAFSMGAAKRGYEVVGLSWDHRNQTVACSRAKLSGIKNVSFPIGDARRLDEYKEFVNAFDIVICFEIIEHIHDDRKLFADVFRCLKPGGRLYLTTPNFYYHALSKVEMGPFSLTEDGWHVRRGYSSAMLRELCAITGFEVEEITYVCHFFSQLFVIVQRALATMIGNVAAWPLILPLRLLPPLLDGWLGKWLGNLFGWPGYCIALVAYKRRFT